MSVQATVQKSFRKTREGRGFSRGELREVGLDFQQALKLHLPIDQRRKTRRAENIKALKLFLSKK